VHLCQFIYKQFQQCALCNDFTYVLTKSDNIPTCTYR
jgi:hypothetical protein